MFMAQDDELRVSSSDPDDQPASSDTGGPLTHRSQDLLQGRREAWIEHGEEMYRLRLTANGKLYLTK